MFTIHKYIIYGGEKRNLKKLIFIVLIITFVSVPVFAMPDYSAVEDIVTENVLQSPEDIINKILSNDLDVDGNNILKNIVELFFSSFKSSLPNVLALFSVTIITSVIEKMKFINGKCETAMLLGGKVIFSTLLINSSLIFVTTAKETLEKISAFTNGLLPVIMTLLATCGSNGTVTILGPAQILLSSVLVNLCVNIILPIVVIGFVTLMINNILSDNKLKGISDLLKNLASWAIGGIFVVFSAIIALQGTIAGVRDGISIRSIKYALSSSVPIIGPSISENLSAVILSALSIKSATGILGIITIIAIVLSPIISIWAYIIILNLFSALVQPFASEFVCIQVRSTTEFLKLTTIVLLGVSILWFIYLGILIISGGNFI